MEDRGIMNTLINIILTIGMEPSKVDEICFSVGFIPIIIFVLVGILIIKKRKIDH